MIIRKIFCSLSIITLLFSCVSVTSYAAPKQMPDGGTFDAEYYKNNNPDVAAAVGTDEAALYQHYLNFGKAEGRLPYEGSATVSSSNSSQGYKGTAGYTTSAFSSNPIIKNLEIGYLNHDYVLIRDTVCGKGFMEMCRSYYTINSKDAYSDLPDFFQRDESNYILPSNIVHIRVAQWSTLDYVEVDFISSNPKYKILSYYRDSKIPSTKNTDRTDYFRYECQTGELYYDGAGIASYPKRYQLFDLLPNNTISVFKDQSLNAAGSTFKTYQPFGLNHNPACDNTVMYDVWN